MEGLFALLLVAGVIIGVVGGAIWLAYTLVAAGSRGISREIARGKEEAKLEADEVRAALALREVEELRVRLEEAERRLADREDE